MKVICYTWGGCEVLWKDANWKWKECLVVEEILGNLKPGVPGDLIIPSWIKDEVPHNPYDKEKRKTFITLISKVKGEDKFEEKKELRDDIKITISDIKLVVRAVKGIDIQIIEE
jgi:hypothetical protein